MRADGVPGCGHLLENCRLIGGMQTDREEDRLGAVCRQCREHCLGILRPGTVVEGEHHLALPQEIVSLEVLEAETRSARRVDLTSREMPSVSGLPGHEEPA